MEKRKKLKERLKELTGAPFAAYTVLLDLLPENEQKKLSASEIINCTGYTSIKPIKSALKFLANNGYVERFRQNDGQAYLYKWP